MWDEPLHRALHDPQPSAPPKDTQAHLSRLLAANYPSVGFERDRGMFGGSAFLNPFPPGWDGFPGDPGGRRHCAFVRLLRLPGYRDIALRAERSGPTPASKSSKAQPAPGLLLEGEETHQALARLRPGVRGRDIPGGRWDGHPPSACPELPSPAGMKLSPSHPSPGKPLPLPHGPLNPRCDPAPAGPPSLALLSP